VSDTTKSAAPLVPAHGLGVLVLALVPFGLGYLLSYLFRAVNAVVAPDLVRELGLGAAELGFLTAAYLLAFALFQLPLGVLLDRYGPRRVQTAMLLIAAGGAALFSVGGTATVLAIARGLIGLGFAGGLMSSFKAVVVWVPEARRALANACVMSLGAVGLIVSTAPMEALVASVGWRVAIAGLAAVTALIAATIFVVVPRDIGNGAPAGTPLGDQFRIIATIYRDRGFMRLAPLLGLTAGTHISVQTLWAAPWARDIMGLDRAGVAQHLFWMACAFFVGILTTGAVADWFKRRRGVSELDVMLAFLAAFLAAQAVIVLDPVPALRVPAWLVFGLTGQVAILAFPWLSSHFGAALSGRANTAMNLMIFAAAFVSQWAIGWIIDRFARTAAGGYAPEAFQAAFGIFLALELAALAWYLAGRRRRA
jgi:MFS family permease